MNDCQSVCAVDSHIWRKFSTARRGVSGIAAIVENWYKYVLPGKERAICSYGREARLRYVFGCESDPVDESEWPQTTHQEQVGIQNNTGLPCLV